LKKLGFLVVVLFLGACTQSDTEHARRQLKTSGEELKKELKSDGRVLKQEAHKAAQELRNEAGKAKRDLNADRKDKDTSSQ